MAADIKKVKQKLLAKLPVRPRIPAVRDARMVARVVLGALCAANLIAALILFKPWGGSAEDMDRELAAGRQQLAAAQTTLKRTKDLASKVEKARSEGDQFMKNYILDRRTAYSTIIGEMDKTASQVGLKPKESQFAVEEIEGSDTLGMMTISAGYEGAYASLTQLVNQIDRSQRFLIVESVQAAPLATGTNLNIVVKLIAFVKVEGSEQL